MFGASGMMKKIRAKKKAALVAADPNAGGGGQKMWSGIGNAAGGASGGGGEDLEARVSALESGGGGGAAKDTSKSFGGMGGGMFDFMRATSNKNAKARAAANVAASGMPYKMPASGKHNNSPIDMNFGSKEHRGFGHNEPIANAKTGETPLDMKSFGVGSLTGGVAAKGRSKTGGGGKFNN